MITANALTPITLADLRRETGALLMFARNRRSAVTPLSVSPPASISIARRPRDFKHRRETLTFAA